MIRCAFLQKQIDNIDFLVKIWYYIIVKCIRRITQWSLSENVVRVKHAITEIMTETDIYDSQKMLISKNKTTVLLPSTVVLC